jgi:hypothetical protein
VAASLISAGGSEVAKSLGMALSEATVPSGSAMDDVSQPAATEVDASDPISDSSLLSAEEIGFSRPIRKEKIDFIDPDDEPESLTPSTPSVPILVPPRRKNFAIKLPKLGLPKIKMPKFKLSGASPIWWYIGGSLTILGLLVFWFMWILPSAIVTVQVVPKTLEENVELTLSSTDSTINFEDRVVPGTIESVSESGEKGMETTGKKIVGEGASGEVTIFNRTSASKSLSKGTSIASGSLKFTLDQDVSVASKSAGLIMLMFQAANVPVTASVIGDESNRRLHRIYDPKFR